MSDLKKYLDSQEIEVDYFDGIKLVIKDIIIAFVSVNDEWHVYKNKVITSYKTQSFIDQLHNII